VTVRITISVAGDQIAQDEYDLPETHVKSFMQDVQHFATEWRKHNGLWKDGELWMPKELREEVIDTLDDWADANGHHQSYTDDELVNELRDYDYVEEAEPLIARCVAAKVVA
jgi:hypothetical protein